MSALSTPSEDLAASLVTVDRKQSGGPLFINLKAPGHPTVCIGPYANPSVAAEEARSIRRFLAAAITTGRTSGQVQAS
jgi:hypothetical protein